MQPEPGRIHSAVVADHDQGVGEFVDRDVRPVVREMEHANRVLTQLFEQVIATEHARKLRACAKQARRPSE